MLTAPGSAPSVSGNAYDMRPENLAETMRRPPPATVESFAVRQYPAARQTSDPAQPFRVSMPLGVSVARDPASLYGEADKSSATLQFASVDSQSDAERIAQRVRGSGLQAYVQAGPGGMGYVVRSQVARIRARCPPPPACCASWATRAKWCRTYERRLASDGGSGRMSAHPLPYAWARAQRAVCRCAAAAPADGQPAHAGMGAARDPPLPRRRGGGAGRKRDDAASVMGVDERPAAADMPEVADLLEAQDDAPVIRMINALFAQARARQRYPHRALRDPFGGALPRRRHAARRGQPRKALHAALISRIKIMAHLDIAENACRRTAASRCAWADGPSTCACPPCRPATAARRAAPLDKEAGRLKLERLGMSAGVLERLDRLIRQPHGIVLVTGPTGSGKTTTLYAALSRLDASTSNILTVEDPIEYDLPGISQTQVNAKIDMSFALALRAILRQDPDVIMIGEIRDLKPRRSRCRPRSPATWCWPRCTPTTPCPPSPA